MHDGVRHHPTSSEKSYRIAGAVSDPALPGGNRMWREGNEIHTGIEARLGSLPLAMLTHREAGKE